MWTYNQSNELCHYGVLGMKWGVRTVGKIAGKQLGRAAFKYSLRTGGKMAGKAMSKNGHGFSNRNSLMNQRLDAKIAKHVGKLDKRYDIADARQDYKSLGRGGVRRINRGIEKGMTYGKSYALETGRRAASEIVLNVGLKLAAAAAVSALAVAGKRYMNREAPRLMSENPVIIEAAYTVLH